MVTWLKKLYKRHKDESTNKHYYNEDVWTKASLPFKDKLRKGECIYAELVGYTPSGQPIMGSHSNEKLKKFMSKSEYKEFINKYGDTTEFTYGCNKKLIEMVDLQDIPKDVELHNIDEIERRVQNNEIPISIAYPQNKVFIYRITMTNEDGESIDLSWEQVKTRSEQLGVAHVPEMHKFIASKNKEGKITTSTGMEIEPFVEILTESDSKNFPQHINEGVCVRIENGSLTPQIYKSKRFIFKCLEGIIKDNPDNIDVEETN